MISKMPRHVSIDDIMQSGYIGLLEAASQYSFEKGASFATYASIRIKGAIIDEIRKGDWTPRAVHRQSRLLMQSIAALEKKNHSSRFSLQELAQEMQISYDEVAQMIHDYEAKYIVSYDAPSACDAISLHEIIPAKSNPIDDVIKQEEQWLLQSALESLKERERIVIVLYYQNNYNLKQIGDLLQIGESRVSQMLQLSLKKIRIFIAKMSQSNQ